MTQLTSFTSNDSNITLIVVIFTIVSFAGVLCGLFSYIFIRKELKGYRENFGLKFKNSLLFGFILLFFNELYWIGNFFSLFLILMIDINCFLSLLFIIIPLWYTLINFISRIGFDLTFDKSPPAPYLKIKDQLIQKGFQEIFKCLEINLNPPIGKLKHRWAMPAGKFISCYLWDTAFISQIWKYWDKNIASEILLPFFDNQAKDGRIPHFISFFNKSKKIQPPLLAWAISNLDVDEVYLKNSYLKLKKFNQWLYKNRRLKNGLFFWKHSYESGIDNSPRFTDRSEKYKIDLTRIAAIDLNTYIVLQNQSLIKIAEKLKEKENKEEYDKDIIEFERKNEDLIGLIQKYLWDEDSGLYFDFDIIEEKKMEINTIASFLPLIAMIPTENQARKLIKHLESPYEYNTKIPLPSVALNDINFEKDTWRGPVWINTAYLIIKGLEKYHRYKLSGEFAYRLIKGVFETKKNEKSHSFYEFYDLERFDLKELTRKKGNSFKQITLGGKPVKSFVGWTGLVNSLFIESVIGYDYLKKTIQPSLPEDLKGRIIVLGLPSESLEIELQYNNEKDISIIVIDLNSKKPSMIKKCSLYEKISLKDFF